MDFQLNGSPLGAHIRIVSEREAVNHELVSHSGNKKIPWLGKTVDFEVIKAFPYHPDIIYYGIETRYEIRVESDELEQIRRSLIGLPPRSLGFCINVAIGMTDWREHMENRSESSSCSEDERRMTRREKTLARDMRSKLKLERMRMQKECRSQASALKINPKLLLWLLAITIISVMFSYGYFYSSNL